MSLDVQTEPGPQEDQRVVDDNDAAIELIQPKTERDLYDIVLDYAERFAATRIGQYVIERGDRVLNTIESTAKWSLPQAGRDDMPLERPLSWLPFLVIILVLRVVRMWLSGMALMIGNEPIKPHDIVYFIQTRRRKLRALRVNGLKAIQQRETEANALRSSSNETTIIDKVRTLLTSAICRPGLQRVPVERIFVARNIASINNVNVEETVERQSNKRPRDEDIVDQNLTVEELLSKYANANSDDDSDFVPNIEAENETSTTTSVDDGSSTDGEGDEGGMNITSENQTNDETSENSVNTTADKSIEIKQNGSRQQQQRMPKPIADIKIEEISDIDNDNVQSPRENGPSKGVEDREINIAPQIVHTSFTSTNFNTPDALNKLSFPNGNELEQQKSTPGHDSAALTKLNIIPTVGATAAAADAILSSPTTVSTKSTSNPSSPLEYSTPLAPFVINDDVIVNDFNSEPRNPTPPLRSNYESSTLTSASSSEDVFLSPIGSPQNFNACFQPVSILKKPTVQVVEVEAHSTPKSAAEDEDTVAPPPQKKFIQPQQQQQQTQRQQHNQHPNRYRGRNRR